MRHLRRLLIVLVAIVAACWAQPAMADLSISPSPPSVTSVPVGLTESTLESNVQCNLFGLPITPSMSSVVSSPANTLASALINAATAGLATFANIGWWVLRIALSVALLFFVIKGFREGDPQQVIVNMATSLPMQVIAIGFVFGMASDMLNTVGSGSVNTWINASINDFARLGYNSSTPQLDKTISLTSGAPSSFATAIGLPDAFNGSIGTLASSGLCVAQSAIFGGYSGAPNDWKAWALNIAGAAVHFAAGVAGGNIGQQYNNIYLTVCLLAAIFIVVVTVRVCWEFIQLAFYKFTIMGIAVMFFPLQLLDVPILKEVGTAYWRLAITIGMRLLIFSLGIPLFLSMYYIMVLSVTTVAGNYQALGFLWPSSTLWVFFSSLLLWFFVDHYADVANALLGGTPGQHGNALAATYGAALAGREASQLAGGLSKAMTDAATAAVNKVAGRGKGSIGEGSSEGSGGPEATTSTTTSAPKTAEGSVPVPPVSPSVSNVKQPVPVPPTKTAARENETANV